MQAKQTLDQARNELLDELDESVDAAKGRELLKKLHDHVLKFELTIPSYHEGDDNQNRIAKHQCDVDFEDEDWKSAMRQQVLEDFSSGRIYLSCLEEISRLRPESFERCRDFFGDYEFDATIDYETQKREFDQFLDQAIEECLSTTDQNLVRKIVRKADQELLRLREALPIYCKKSEILKAIRNHRVFILKGTTGTGKTTQLPHYVLEALSQGKRVILVLPHRHTVWPIASRIQAQFDDRVVTLGKYSHKIAASAAKIEVHTYRSMIELMKQDKYLSNYSYVIMDEIHEREMFKDLAFSLMSGVLENNQELKVVLASATADLDVYKKHFTEQLKMEIPVLDVPGASHKVQVKSRGTLLKMVEESKNDGEGERGKYKIEGFEAQKMEILKLFNEEVAKINSGSGEKSYFNGNIMIFVLDRWEISTLIEELSSRYGYMYDVLPYHGRLSEKEMKRPFEPSDGGKLRIIVSNKLGENAITIPGVTVVIDTGRGVDRKYCRKTYTNSSHVCTITKSAATQRLGRTGRTCPGICYRLYLKQELEKFKLYEQSALLKIHYYEVVLLLKKLGHEDPMKFPFIEPLTPESKEEMRLDMELLQIIGGVDRDNGITPLGSFMVEEHTLKVNQVRVLYEAVRNGCHQEIIKILIMWQQDWNLYHDKITVDELKSLRKNFDSEELGYFNMLLNIFDEYKAIRESKNEHEVNSWLKDNKLEIKPFMDYAVKLEYLEDITRKLKEISSSERASVVYSENNSEKVHKCLLAGYFMNVCYFDLDENKFKLARSGNTIHIKNIPNLTVFEKKELAFVPTELTINEDWKTSHSPHGCSIDSEAVASTQSIEGDRCELTGDNWFRVKRAWLKDLTTETKSFIDISKIVEDCEPIRRASGMRNGYKPKGFHSNSLDQSACG